MCKMRFREVNLDSNSAFHDGSRKQKLTSADMLRGPETGGPVRLLTTDCSVFELQEVRKELPCTVTPFKPELEFDLSFHTDYEVGIPAKDLAGPGDVLTVLFRVTSNAHIDDLVYFSQRMSVPLIDENAKGIGYVDGAFELGEGQYKVDFLIRNRREQICSAYWNTEARLSARDKQLALTLAPDAVQDVSSNAFAKESRLMAKQMWAPCT